MRKLMVVSVALLIFLAFPNVNYSCDDEDVYCFMMLHDEMQDIAPWYCCVICFNVEKLKCDVYALNGVECYCGGKGWNEPIYGSASHDKVNGVIILRWDGWGYVEYDGWIDVDNPALPSVWTNSDGAGGELVYLGRGCQFCRDCAPE